MKHYILRRDGVVQSFFFNEKKFREKYEYAPRRRKYERRFGKRIRVWKKKISIVLPPPGKRRFCYCFVKGFNTGADRSRFWHWVETSVDVWCEFVVEVPEGETIEVWEKKNLPSDETMIMKIEAFLEKHLVHSWIMSLKQTKHVWGVEREETIKPITWPDGEVSAWTMPDYERKLIDKERIKLG